jgi:hypothetical protein
MTSLPRQKIETYLTPDGRDHKVTGVVAVINETI